MATKAFFTRSDVMVGEAEVHISIDEASKIVLYFLEIPPEPSFVKRLQLLSPNERKAVIAQLEKQIDGYDVGDCPTIYRAMLSAIKAVG